MKHNAIMAAKKLKPGKTWEKVAEILEHEKFAFYTGNTLAQTVKRHDSKDCAQCIIDELEIVIMKAILALEVDASVGDALKILRRL